MGRSLLDSSLPQTLYKTYEFQEIGDAKAASAVGQCSESVLWSQVGPAQRNLTLPAFLIEKRDSIFAAVFFATEGLKLATGQRMKGMSDPKFLGLYSTNACSAMPFPIICGIPDLLRLDKISPRGMYAGNGEKAFLTSGSAELKEASQSRSRCDLERIHSS